MKTKAREIVERHGQDITSDDASREVGIYVRALLFDDGQTFAKLLANALRDQRKANNGETVK